MQVHNQGNNTRRRGAALIYAMLIAFSASALVSVLMTVSISSTRTATTKRSSTQARYLAEAGIETAKRDVVDALANWKQVPATGNVAVAGQNSTYSVTPTGFQSIVSNGGIQTIVTGYELQSTAQAQGHSVTAHRLVNAEATPIFQFAVFYTDDLEINPGANMSLGGRVHSNANMYLNCGNTLTMNTNYVRAVGGIYRHRKDDASKSQGTVKVRNYVDDPYDISEPLVYTTMKSKSQLGNQGIPSTSGYDSDFTSGWDANGDGDFNDPGDLMPWGPGALAYWSEPGGYTGSPGNTIKSAAHGVGLASVPTIGSIQMYEAAATGGTHYWDAGAAEYMPAALGMGTHNKGFFHSEADLSIITYTDNSWAAFDQSGTDITAALGSVISKGKMYDARQANGSVVKIRLAKLDVAALNASGLFPANGLIYAAHYGASDGIRAKGLQIKNGSELAAPLTIVSENSIYVQGDYNTVNKKGAAVIGDAVNLLSNNWSNSGKYLGSGLPDATETTFNVAIITGNQATQGSAYNGGLENLPRFHEKWTGVACNITGSFVNTWESQYATGAWKYGSDRYKAPVRNWSYDTAFNNVANLPPYTPLAVTGRDVAVW